MNNGKKIDELARKFGALTTEVERHRIAHDKSKGMKKKLAKRRLDSANKRHAAMKARLLSAVNMRRIPRATGTEIEAYASWLDSLIPATCETDSAVSARLFITRAREADYAGAIVKAWMNLFHALAHTKDAGLFDLAVVGEKVTVGGITGGDANRIKLKQEALDRRKRLTEEQGKLLAQDPYMTKKAIVATLADRGIGTISALNKILRKPNKKS